MMAVKPGAKYNTRQATVTEKSENMEASSVGENSQDDEIVIIEHSKQNYHEDNNALKPKITRGRLRRRTFNGRVAKPSMTKRATSRTLRASMRQLASKRKELNLKALVFPRTVESAKHPEVDGSVSNKILFASALGLLPGKFSIENIAITNDSRCPTKVTSTLDKDRNNIYKETQNMIATINSAMMPPDNLNDSIEEMGTSPGPTIINSDGLDFCSFDNWTNCPRFPHSASSGIGSGSNSSSPSKVSAISTDTSGSEDIYFGVGRKQNNRHPTQLGIENGPKRASKVVFSSLASVALIVEDVAIGIRGRDLFSLKLGEIKNADKGSGKNLPSLKQVTEDNDGSDTASEDETTGEEMQSFVFGVGNKTVQRMSVKIPSPDVDESMEESSSEEEKKPKVKRKRQKFRRLRNGFILM